MNESENDFESLRRALALKRHEIPPPGYFNDFSRHVISRIRAGEVEQPTMFALPSWLLSFFQILDAKPAYVGSIACSLCLLLLFGIVYVERPDATLKPTVFATMSAPSLSLAEANGSDLAVSPQPTGLMVTTNPVLSLQPAASVFGQPSPLAQPQTVGWMLPGN